MCLCGGVKIALLPLKNMFINVGEGMSGLGCQIAAKHIKTHQDANETYNNFISIFCTIYDTFFPTNKMKIKAKDLESP